jgi:AcrR family transcriptional regulator
MAKGDETRQQIVQRAFDAAKLTGLSGLSIGRLAEEMTLSKSGLFAHFGSKEALEIAVIGEASRQFVHDVMAPALRSARGEPRLRAFFEHWLEWGSRPGGCFFIAASAELDDKPGKPREALIKAYKDWMDELTTAARIAISEGHFRPDVDPQQIAFETYSVVLGAHLFGRVLRDPKAITRTKKTFERILQSARPEGAKRKS